MADPRLQTSEIPREFINRARSYLREDYLPKMERCVGQLSDEQLWWRPNEASNSIGNLVLHLSGNARQWIVSGLGGREDHRVRQEEFDQRDIISRTDLLKLLRTTIADVDAVLKEFDEGKLLDQYSIQSYQVNALEAIFHVTEHFSMHTGQIILLTKQLTASDLKFYDL